MKLIPALLLASSVLFLSACQMTTLPSIQHIDKPSLGLADPAPLNLDKVDITVITPENKDEIFAQLKGKNISPNLFAVTSKGYAAIVKNNGKLRAYIAAQRNIIQRYREYYEGK